MHKHNQKGFFSIPLLIVILLVIGVVLGVYLSAQRQIFRPKAFLGEPLGVGEVGVVSNSSYQSEPSYASDRLIIQLKEKSFDSFSKSSQDEIENMLKDVGAKLNKEGEVEKEPIFGDVGSDELTQQGLRFDQNLMGGFYVVKLNQEVSLDSAINVLGKSKYIEYIAKDYYVSVFGIIEPNDYYYGNTQKFYLNLIRMREGWQLLQSDIGSNRDKVKVAIVDSGITPDHEDLKGVEIENGYSLIDHTNDVYDFYGHGTAVSGVVAAAVNNELGIAGADWFSPFYGQKIVIKPYKVLDSNGITYLSQVSAAIYKATRDGSRVINLSLGVDGFDCSRSEVRLLAEVIRFARGNGVTLVAAAGNQNSTAVGSPASCPGVISVGSVDAAGGVSSFSNYGSGVVIAAPGERIISLTATNCASTWCGDVLRGSKYVYVSGTSIAAPYVSAAAAMLLYANPTLRPDDVKNCLSLEGNTTEGTSYEGRAAFRILNVEKMLNNCMNLKPAN